MDEPTKTLEDRVAALEDFARKATIAINQQAGMQAGANAANESSFVLLWRLGALVLKLALLVGALAGIAALWKSCHL
jgi:hypothetical protein